MNDSLVMLLKEFRATRSEPAFAQIVRQTVNLVFSVARRRLADSSLVEDVTQSVFTRLSRNPPKSRKESDLLGWLHATTIHVSVDMWRSEVRRRNREIIAASMNDHSTPADPIWNELAPQLDEAVQSLPDLDRRAVLLRYFHNKPHREVAQELGISEAAAKMRVNRAVDQLREKFGANGITCTAAGLAQLLDAGAIQSAPDALVSKVSRLPANPGPTATHVGRRVTVTTKVGILPWVLGPLSPLKLAFAIGLVGAGIALSMRLRTQESPDGLPVEATPESTVRLPAPAIAPLEARVRSGGVPGSPMDPALLASLIEELRALLKKPPVVTRHPPERLLTLLQRFSRELPAAIPILVEGLAADDHETRLWALDGLENVFGRLAQQSGATAGDFTAAYASVGSNLGRIVRDEDQSTQQRTRAFQTLLSPWDFPNGVFVGTPFSAEVIEEIIASLKQTSPKASVSSIRFTEVDLLGFQSSFDAAAKAQVITAVLPLLSHPSSEDRLLAAYAAAAWSVEPPPEVKQELVRQLREKPNSLHYLAAKALGALGSAAADVVPDLLKYVPNPRSDRMNEYYCAMEAVCRIQPELRSQYPEIDVRLKDQEEARELALHPENQKPDPAEMLKALKGPDAFQDLLTFVRESTDPAAALEGALRSIGNLESQLEDPSQVAELREFISKAREMAAKPPASDETATQPVAQVFELIMDARTLSAFSPERFSRERAADLKAAIDEAAEAQNLPGGEDRLKPFELGAYRRFAEKLKSIDPIFHRAWLVQIRKNYPAMDRILQEQPPSE